MKEFLKSMKTMIFSIVVVLLLMNFVFINAYVPTGSMENTIMAGDRVLGIRFICSYQRGDVIVFKDPDGSGHYLMKRIIGMPGDIVKIETRNVGFSQVSVNGIFLSEPYLKEVMTPEEFEIRVPAGGYFVMGDNRNGSYDARYWTNKIVREDEITGIVAVKYWPFPGAGILR